MLKIITISCIIAAVSLNSQKVKGSLLPNIPNIPNVIPKDISKNLPTNPSIPDILPNIPNIPNVIPKDISKNLPNLIDPSSISNILPKDLIKGLTDGILKKGLSDIIAKSSLGNIVKIIQKVLNAEVACSKAFNEGVDLVSKSVSAFTSCFKTNGTTTNIKKLIDQASDVQKSVHDALQQCSQNSFDESCLNTINKSLAGLNMSELIEAISEILSIYPLNLIGSLASVLGCIDHNLSQLNVNFCTTALDTGYCIRSIVQIFI